MATVSSKRTKAQSSKPMTPICCFTRRLIATPTLSPSAHISSPVPKAQAAARVAPIAVYRMELVARSAMFDNPAHVRSLQRYQIEMTRTKTNYTITWKGLQLVTHAPVPPRDCRPAIVRRGRLGGNGNKPPLDRLLCM